MRGYSTQISVVEVQSSALCALANELRSTSARVDSGETDPHPHCTFRRMWSGCAERTNEPRLDTQQWHDTADRSIAEYNRCGGNTKPGGRPNQASGGKLRRT